MVGKIVATLSGAVTAAVGSAVCCAGPTVAAALGLSGAGLSGFLPYRPYLLFASVGFLWVGHSLVDRIEPGGCEPDSPCAEPKFRRNTRNILWVSTGLVWVFISSPWWVKLF